MTSHAGRGAVSAAAERRELAEYGYRRSLAIRLKRDYDTGATYRELGQRHGIAQGTVGCLLRRLANEISTAAVAGVDSARLSREYGVSEGVMHAWVTWAATVPRHPVPPRRSTLRAELSGLLRDRLDQVMSAMPAATASRRPPPISTVGRSLTQQQLTDVIRAVGAALRGRRRKLGWSTERVITVMRVDLCRASIMGYETGTRSMSLARFLQYCLALGANPGDVIDNACAAVLPRDADDPVTVDVVKLASTEHPELQGLRRWAATQAKTLPRTAHGLVQLTTPALERLATLSGLDRQQLADALSTI